MTPAVSVVIPNWNGRRFLDACLGALRDQTFGPLEVVLVDNGSTDGSVAHVRSTFPGVRVVGFDDNRGFDAAVNAGIAHSTGPYVFVLNNDTEAHPRCVEHLVKALEQAPDVAAVGPKLLDFADRTLLGGIGDAYTFAGVPGSVGFLERDRGQFDVPLEVLSPSACAALYRRDALERVGGFDDDFFAYLEDVDLGLRLQLAGYRCLYVPDAVVYHVGSGSTGGGLTPFKLGLCAQNMVALAVKNLPAPLLAGVGPFWGAVQAVMLARLLLSGQPGRRALLAAYGRGLGRALRQLPRTLAKRRVILGRARLSAGELRRRIGRSEAMLLESLLRARGAGWRWAPAVRLYLGAVSSRLGR